MDFNESITTLPNGTILKRTVQKCVFLTRGELYVHGEDSISVHLKPNDPRIKQISKGIITDLKIVTINPKKSSSFYLSFHRDTWYLISTLEYTGSATFNGYVHFSFRYKLNGSYVNKFDDQGLPTSREWDRPGVRVLAPNEIPGFKSSLCLFK
jgi:hypothetical protein